MQKNKDFRKKRNPNSSEKTGGKSSGKGVLVFIQAGKNPELREQLVLGCV